MMTDFMEYTLELDYKNDMFENHRTDPRQAQLLSTRPNQFLPAQIQTSPIWWGPAQSGNTVSIRRRSYAHIQKLPPEEASFLYGCRGFLGIICDL